MPACSWKKVTDHRRSLITRQPRRCVIGHRNREIELKLLIPGMTYSDVCSALDSAFESESPIIRVGSSLDTYWSVQDRAIRGSAHDGTGEADFLAERQRGPEPRKVEAQFLRVRERDGIRQITVKGKDRGDNVNRIEVDIDSTSETHKIHRLVRCVLGKPAGIIAKTYRVWELESEYDTVCAYEVTTPKYGNVIVEVEARTEERMRQLEQQVKRVLVAVPAPGSLYEMLITREVK